MTDPIAPAAHRPRAPVPVSDDHASHDHAGHDHAGHAAQHRDSHDHGDHDHTGHDHSGHDHSGHGHSHAPQVTGRNERAVLLGFLLTFGFMFAEAIGGVLSGSLALIADAGHMLTDAAALALAWAGFRYGRRVADGRRTFGYARFEVLAGFVNAIALILLVGWIAFEAIARLATPAPVAAGPMMVIAALGLLVNVLVFWMLSRGDRDHVNIRGAMLHVLGDLLGSVAALVAGVVIWATGWTPIDPILSLVLSALILRSGWALLRSSTHILMEGTPEGTDLDAMRARLVAAVPGVRDVSHLHVWSITSGRPAATLSARLDEGADPASAVAGIKGELSARFGIGHATVEVDWAASGSGAESGFVCSLEPGKRSLP